MSRRVTVIVEGREYVVEVGDLDESPIKATVNQRTYRVEVPHEDEAPTAPEVRPAPATPAKAEPSRLTSALDSAVSAPMPGNIVEVKVKAGDHVDPGDVVCVLEAMKMKNMIRSNRAGIISAVDVVPGQAVDFGEILVRFE